MVTREICDTALLFKDKGVQILSIQLKPVYRTTVFMNFEVEILSHTI